MNPRATDQDLREVASDIIRGVKREYDTNTGLVVADGLHGQALAQLPSAQPYGLRSNSPAGTELVIAYTAGGVIVVGERGNLPSGVSEPAAGATKLYNAQGCEVHLDENGDIIHEPKSGRFVLLGSGATKKVVLDQDDVNKYASVPGFDFASWMTSVETVAQAGGGVVSPLAASITKIGTVKTSATKVKAE